jgi:hypothetical protein
MEEIIYIRNRHTIHRIRGVVIIDIEVGIYFSKKLYSNPKRRFSR